jgi:hypothetical protein
VVCQVIQLIIQWIVFGSLHLRLKPLPLICICILTLTIIVAAAMVVQMMRSHSYQASSHQRRWIVGVKEVDYHSKVKVHQLLLLMIKSLFLVYLSFVFVRPPYTRISYTCDACVCMYMYVVGGPTWWRSRNGGMRSNRHTSHISIHDLFTTISVPPPPPNTLKWDPGMNIIPTLVANRINATNLSSLLILCCGFDDYSEVK